MQSLTCLAADMCLTQDPGVASLIAAQSHTFVAIDHEIISMVILLPAAEPRRFVVSYKPKYVHEVLGVQRYTDKRQFTLNKYCIAIHFRLYGYTSLPYVSSSQFSSKICKKISIIIPITFLKKRWGYSNCLRPSVTLSPPKPFDKIQPNSVCELLT